MDFERQIDVYIKVDNDNNIISIGSDIFIDNILGWLYIDSGYGDKYAHAQTQYLPKPLKNKNGGYNYQYLNGTIKDIGA